MLDSTTAGRAPDENDYFGQSSSARYTSGPQHRSQAIRRRNPKTTIACRVHRCHERFGCPSTLLIHLKKHKLYPCNECGEIYSSNKNRKTHTCQHKCLSPDCFPEDAIAQRHDPDLQRHDRQIAPGDSGRGCPNKSLSVPKEHRMEYWWSKIFKDHPGLQPRDEAHTRSSRDTNTQPFSPVQPGLQNVVSATQDEKSIGDNAEDSYHGPEDINTSHPSSDHQQWDARSPDQGQFQNLGPDFFTAVPPVNHQSLTPGYPRGGHDNFNESFEPGPHDSVIQNDCRTAMNVQHIPTPMTGTPAWNTAQPAISSDNHNFSIDTSDCSAFPTSTFERQNSVRLPLSSAQSKSTSLQAMVRNTPNPAYAQGPCVPYNAPSAVNPYSYQYPIPCYPAPFQEPFRAQMLLQQRGQPPTSTQQLQVSAPQASQLSAPYSYRTNLHG